MGTSVLHLPSYSRFGDTKGDTARLVVSIWPEAVSFSLALIRITPLILGNCN